ncbi:putative bifunctional diguanylate cyclase/phosphodiesterase [Crenobacter cavernae]|uniref:Bifunctional diguanylate cyclase/phosphodiesterase n=1 Tax=Crenobacter cavernae TaxID=2290923 RepID=A0A345Y3Y2_9NEIS|nr:bifunctional diguanylate cyclase/phosphodiesterase [Crenobacter cavernae]AXK38634.1 bifunctional diguanylate cyclase/phosphodiesterase [Crenobacter cavernae]
MPPPSTTLSPPGLGPDVLERRLLRERAARKAAEQLLNSKSLELYEASQRSSHAQRLLELALWASSESIWEWSAEHDLYVVRTFPDTDSPPAVRHGLLREFMGGLHPEDRDKARVSWQRHVAGATDVLEIAVRHRGDEGWRWLRIRGKVVEWGADRQAVRVVGTVKDITSHRDAEHSFRLMASAFASSRDAMTVLSETWQIIEANKAFQQLALAESYPIEGAPLSHYLELPAELLDEVGQRGYAQRESRFRTHRLDQIPVEVTLSRFVAGDGAASYLIATIRDITDRKQAASELERIAHFDALTQLPNRVSLQLELARRLQHISPEQSQAVLFLDLDGFKEVNDSLGHDAGDELLRTMARRLPTLLGPKDMLARWGGDEFVALLAIEGAAERAQEIAQLILSTLSQRMEIRGHGISVSGSIGIALAPHDGQDVETILRHADAAMYAAKHAGKNRCAAYHKAMTADALWRVTLLAQLRAAVEQDGLDFVLQPKFSARGTIVGAELLARWNTKQHGTISPSLFIPLAEQNGLAAPLGRLAIQKAAQYAATLAQNGHPIPVAVNISPLQVLDDQLASVLQEACRAHRIEPAQLELEVTESIFLQDSDTPVQRLMALREKGFPIAMDDFGTGYSSLGYLRRLPFDTIKIDRSFLVDVDQDEKSKRLLIGIVNLCSLLGVHTVAEGVETAEQFHLLQELGVVHYQGFFLARPMPLKGVLALLAVHSTMADSRVKPGMQRD